MKNPFIKMAKYAVIAASALAFMNCGEDSISATDNSLAAGSSDSAEVVLPATGADSLGVAETPSDAAVINPVSSSGVVVDVPASSETVVVDPVEIGSSASVDPVMVSSSSETIVPESSSAVAPAVVSSSSEIPVVESSSSEIPVVESSSSETPVVESSSSVAPVQQAPSIFLSENGDEDNDQLEVERMEKVGPDGAGILAYPKNMSTDPNVKHAVVIWGPGGGTEPSAYNGMINRLASHGFVVFALSSSPGDASKAIAALDWLEERNNLDYGVLSGKLDMTKVGCSGHSMGGLESEQALIKDSRVITAIMNNSGDLGHTAMASVSTSKTIAIVYGEGGMERPNAEADYGNSAVSAPACLIKMTGGTGTECQNGECGWGHGSGPWGGMAATVSWMRWHLGGEEERKADFVGTSGAYINGPIVGSQGNWKGQCKNF